MVADLERLATEGAISTQNIRLTARNIINFNIGDTPVSLGRTEMFHDDPREEVESKDGRRVEWHQGHSGQEDVRPARAQSACHGARCLRFHCRSNESSGGSGVRLGG